MPTDRPDPVKPSPAVCSDKPENAGAPARVWASDRLAVAACYDDCRTLLAALARSKKPEHGELYDVLLAGLTTALQEVARQALKAEPPGWRKVARALEARPQFSRENPKNVRAAARDLDPDGTVPPGSERRFPC